MSSHAETSIAVTANKASRSEAASLAVEASGWYGFCFEPLNPPTGSDFQDELRAVLEVSVDESSAPCSHSLPLFHQKESLKSLQYGRLMYLSKDTSLRVNICATSGSGCNGSDKGAKWRLVLQSWANLSNESNGKLFDGPKCIICASCRKTFTTRASIETHIHAVHRTIDTTSVWHSPLRVLYQDNDMVIVDKPQGISVMGDDGMTLQKSDLLMPLASNDGKLKPVPVHRLDAMTGGLLVVAKSKEMESKLRTCFMNRKCSKRYRALVFGKLEREEGVIVEEMGGRSAETRFQVVAYTRSADPMADHGWITTVDLYPVTGRKHQLRKHMRHVGHAIWGDKRYARYPKQQTHLLPTLPSNTDDKRDKVDILLDTTIEENPHIRLCLWAIEITLPHPRTGINLTVTMEEPDWLQKMVKHQEEQWFRQARLTSKS